MATGSDLIKLSFGVESSAGLWNIIFEGFDQDITLVSRFEGRDPKSRDLLKRFARILKKKYPGCLVEPAESGLSIKKSFPKNDISEVRAWSDLMTSVREEMLNLIAPSRP